MNTHHGGTEAQRPAEMSSFDDPLPENWRAALGELRRRADDQVRALRRIRLPMLLWPAWVIKWCSD